MEQLITRSVRGLLNAFDSLHRSSLWKILRHYGIPQKFVKIIQALYENIESRVVIHYNKVTKPFRVDAGIKKGCILSPVLFSIAVDWLIRTVTQGRRQVIRWVLITVLVDQDYADDIGRLSSQRQGAQQIAERLSKTANAIGLKFNTENIQVEGRTLE